MIRIDEIKIPVGEDGNEAFLLAAARRLGISVEGIKNYRILRRSIDARKKPSVFFVYSLAVEVDGEETLLKKDRGRHLSKYKKKEYRIPVAFEDGRDSAKRQASPGDMKRSPLDGMKRPFPFDGIKRHRPVVVGAGPAGLFCAYVLARAGLAPLLIERGEAVYERTRAVNEFFQTGRLRPESNVLFGEGGAGTFSDGKLNTSNKDKTGRHAFVLETFVRYGADSTILYDAKPHIGTDRLLTVIPAIREAIKEAGGEVRFGTCLEGLVETDGRLVGIRLSDGEELRCDTVVLATGHSARDTFERLYADGLAMVAKEFAVGFRVEHPQEMINRWQYGKGAAKLLPAAPYKLVARGLSRPVYSFCMCPGGYVINSSSEPGGTCVNGMSYEARDGANANSAIVVAVGAKEYDMSEPMAAIAYQRHLERAVYERGQGAIVQQLFGDFLSRQKSTSYGGYASMTRGRAVLSDLRGILSAEIEDAFLAGMLKMDEHIRGFADSEVILSGVESRTSSPIRIPRDENCMGSIIGLYPCGEGAGYAGGIASAAVDGVRVAEAVVAGYRERK